MAYNFGPMKDKLKQADEWLRKEFSSIRTGRANPAILDTVVVEAYGSKMGVKELASISGEDARSLRVTPYDMSQLKDIEKAITQSNLGLSVAADDRGIRLTFPELTGERRIGFVKIAKEKLEEARIKVRGIRDEVWKEIQNKERAKEIGEDEKFRLKDEMEKLVVASGKSFDEQFSKKEKEILS